jgi:hypothetical protein
MREYSQVSSPLDVPPAGEPGDERLLRVRQRHDGYHWADASGLQEFGPYETPEKALADMVAPGEPAIEQSEADDREEQFLGLPPEASTDGDDETPSAP